MPPTGYDDVLPAIAELKAHGYRTFLTSSLSGAATAHFLERYVLKEFFFPRSGTETIRAASKPHRFICDRRDISQTRGGIFITDTLEGLKVSKTVDSFHSDDE